MRVGFILPNIGPVASPALVGQVAQTAEALGYDSLWVTERLLYPVKPQTPYPATADGSLPAAYKHVLDPVATLTFVAARTSRVALGTSVLDIPYYNPVLLARQLTTLDVLSGGRVRVGLGIGWSKDEFDAVGASLADRGRRADEFLQVLKAIWTTDPAEFRGRYYQLPRSFIGPKPVQKPHPPIYLAAFVPQALRRAAVYANGWNPVGIPADGMAKMMAQLREMAAAAGRDPAAMEVVVRATIDVTPRPLGADRWTFSGSLDQPKTDIDAVRALGVQEGFFDPTVSPAGETADLCLACMARIRKRC